MNWNIIQDCCSLTTAFGSFAKIPDSLQVQQEWSFPNNPLLPSTEPVPTFSEFSLSLQNEFLSLILFKADFRILRMCSIDQEKQTQLWKELWNKFSRIKINCQHKEQMASLSPAALAIDNHPVTGSINFHRRDFEVLWKGNVHFGD